MTTPSSAPESARATPAPASARALPARLLRWYAVFPVALPLIALDAFWVIEAEKVGQGPYFTTVSLFANVLDDSDGSCSS